MCVYMHVRMCVYMHVRVCVQVYARVCVHACVCMCVCLTVAYVHRSMSMDAALYTTNTFPGKTPVLALFLVKSLYTHPLYIIGVQYTFVSLFSALQATLFFHLPTCVAFQKTLVHWDSQLAY